MTKKNRNNAHVREDQLTKIFNQDGNNPNGNVVFSMHDPRITDDEKKILFEIGSRFYGVPDWKLEDLHLVTEEEADASVKKMLNELTELESRLEKSIEGERRAKAILAAMQDDTVTTYGREQVIKNNPIDVYTLCSILNEALRMNASDRASLGGEARKNKDPKQLEKAIVYECWKIWKEKPATYKNDSVFAQKMLDKFRPEDPGEEYLHLQSSKVISDWCTAWKTGADFGTEKTFLLENRRAKKNHAK